MEQVKRYSQNNEQEILVDALGSSGRFLDIGAYDGVTFSNTRRLFELGWDGVCVEPSPECYAGLERNYSGIQNIDLVNAAISDHTGELTFYNSGGDAISTTDKGHVAKWEAGFNCKFDEITVECITFQDLFDMHGDKYDFVNIDTESTNIDILKLFPFDRCVPKCICIEHDNKFEEIKNILRPFNYAKIHQNGENAIYVR